MFSIEHDFAATVITLVDEPEPGAADRPLLEDVVIRLGDEGAEILQHDEESGRTQRIRLSNSQLDDLAAALHLPEGVWRRVREG